MGLRRTPLHAVHAALGARLVEFGGFEMPVQYAGIKHEHAAVRERAGVFDDLSDQIADPVNTRERGGAGSRSLRRGSGAIVLCASLGFGHVGLATEGHRAAHHLPGMGRERHGDGNVGMSALSVRLTLPLLAALLRGLSSRPGNLSLCASVGPGAIRSAGSPGRGSS